MTEHLLEDMLDRVTGTYRLKKQGKWKLLWWHIVG